MFEAFVSGIGYSCGAAVGCAFFVLLYSAINWLFGTGGRYENSMDQNERQLFELKRRNKISELMELHLRVIAKCMKREDDADNA